MKTLSQAFGLPTGLSDHTMGTAASLAAVALGASVIEKHFTIDREMEGPDHKASLTPEELKELVRGARQIEAALGSTQKLVTPSEWKNRAAMRKSLCTLVEIKKGERFTEENLGTKRPGTGISPMEYWNWVGKTADRDYRADESL